LQARILGNDWLHLDPPRHLYQFSAMGMRSMLEQAGLNVERVETGAFEMGSMGILQGILNKIIRPRDLFYNMLSTRNRCPGGMLSKLASIMGAVLLAPLCGIYAATEMAFGGGVILRYVCRKPVEP